MCKYIYINKTCNFSSYQPHILHRKLLISLSFIYICIYSFVEFFFDLIIEKYCTLINNISNEHKQQIVFTYRTMDGKEKKKEKKKGLF
jgi:hypothetical protein